MDDSKQIENRSITIYDIAREAGVSPATVSRVLTNNVNVRKEKKERVLSLIEKYNYKPNALARGLADMRRNVIGIIAADIRNPYYARVFVACEQAARERGYTVLLCNSFGELEVEVQQLEKLEEQRVDAIIQIGGRVDDLQSNIEYVEKVNRLTNTIPIIIGGKLDGTDCYQVRIDAMAAMDLLMEHLVSLHHEKIAMIGGRQDVISTFEKMQRYKQQLAKYNLKYREELVEADGSYDYETGYQQMNQMLDRKAVPTAVIAINDTTAAGVMRSIVEHGYRVPEDISVVSYDNTYVTELLTPKLTSVDYNYEIYGACMIDTAIAAISGETVPRQQLITPRLVVRESSTFAPKAG